MDTDRDTATDVAVVGGGVAGLTAATFTARAGLDTLVVHHGESILARNAHLENVPGFPFGVNARTFLSLLREQAGENGVSFREARVARAAAVDDGFRLRVESAAAESDVDARHLIAASWPDTSYLEEVSGVGLVKRGSKTYVDVDERGRTGVDRLYAAGRVAEKPHQTVVAAGHGAEVALTLIDDSDVPYYHDWVAPNGYFTDRGRDVPPGCEVIDEAERTAREQASLERLRAAFVDPQPEPPSTHPSVAEDAEE